MDGDSSAKFIGSLTKFLQSLCNGYVEFQRGVELVGHIYLNIDTGEKVDYILHERVSKNDENSVTFVSNSFHAQPQEKDKEKAKEPAATTNAKSGKSERLRDDDDDDDDDDDIMIVDQSQGIIGSTNTGSVLSRGVKRMTSPGLDHRHSQRARTSAGLSSSHNISGHSFSLGIRQNSGRPSATATSQGASQNENLNISEVKLEQITKDELLSLASQVGEGSSAAPPPHASSAASHSQPHLSGSSSRGEPAVWVKQEVSDDGGGGGNDAGWLPDRDDSNSNSSSNLYPVMIHQNPTAFPTSSMPGFPGPSGSGNQSAFPMPGTSQDMSGLDPTALAGALGYQQEMVGSSYHRSYPASQVAEFGCETPLSSAAMSMRRYRQRMKQNPESHAQYKQRQIAYQKRYISRMKLKDKQFGEKLQGNEQR
ncbi:hypothetical protein ACOMHN_036070 [Nucella lapillus]